MKIDKDVPAPNGVGGNSKYPWPEMDVGDSVFFEVEFFNGMTKQQVAAHQYGKNNNKKFKSRKQTGGVRIWRIA